MSAERRYVLDNDGAGIHDVVIANANAATRAEYLWRRQCVRCGQHVGMQQQVFAIVFGAAKLAMDDEDLTIFEKGRHEYKTLCGHCFEAFHGFLGGAQLTYKREASDDPTT